MTALAQDISVRIVRTLDDVMKVVAVRSLVYMGEQHCPYDEEFDGNDFAGATHLLACLGGEPVGVMRLRWFSDFAKVERVAVLRERRGRAAVAALIDAASTLAARKGYRKILGHIQARLLPFWVRSGGVYPRRDRPHFSFSDHEYIEVIRDLAPPANAIGWSTPAMELLRPEGEWDQDGVLDRSQTRGVTMQHAA